MYRDRTDPRFRDFLVVQLSRVGDKESTKNVMAITSRAFDPSNELWINDAVSGGWGRAE
jgi:hypothetical protein